MLTEKTRAGAHVITMLGSMSNDAATIAAGPALDAGTVLALDGGVYAPYDNASDKLGTAAAVLYAPLPASTAPRRAAVTVRLAELMASGLVGLDDPARADLAARFIILR